MYRADLPARWDLHGHLEIQRGTKIFFCCCNLLSLDAHLICRIPHRGYATYGIWEKSFDLRVFR